MQKILEFTVQIEHSEDENPEILEAQTETFHEVFDRRLLKEMIEVALENELEFHDAVITKPIIVHISDRKEF